MFLVLPRCCTSQDSSLTFEAAPFLRQIYDQTGFQMFSGSLTLSRVLVLKVHVVSIVVVGRVFFVLCEPLLSLSTAGSHQVTVRTTAQSLDVSDTFSSHQILYNSRKSPSHLSRRLFVYM